jgi:cell division protein FtsW
VAVVGILTVVAVLDVIGLVMVLSASSVLAIRGHHSPWYYVERQAAWAVLGAGAMAAGWKLDHRVWRRLARPLTVLVGLCLVAVLVPGIGSRVSGSSRWLGIGQISFQPSELAKLALAVFCADLLARRADRIADPRQALAPVAIVCGGLAALTLIEPDMGTASVLVLIGLVVFYVAGPPRAHLVKAVAAVVGASFLLAWAEPYRRARLLGFLHPFAGSSANGYNQLAQSLMGLGSGGATGVGLGQSRAKWGFLPNAHTDFIFSIIGEEAGLVGSILVVLLFLVLALLGLRAARRSPDRFGSLLAAGITAWIVGQAFINIGAVIGILPVTGVPLPFVSMGGSSLVFTMGAAGILAAVARAGEERRPGPARARPGPRPPAAPPPAATVARSRRRPRRP